MNKFENGLLFSLDVKSLPVFHNRKSRRNKDIVFENEYIWHISKYVKTEFSGEFGRCEGPSTDIGNGLNNENVLLNLNFRECFEFEYVPKEGDYLIIREKIKNHFTPFLSFIFKNNEWIVDDYTFYDQTELMYCGIVKVK